MLQNAQFHIMNSKMFRGTLIQNPHPLSVRNPGCIPYTKDQYKLTSWTCKNPKRWHPLVNDLSITEFIEQQFWGSCRAATLLCCQDFSKWLIGWQQNHFKTVRGLIVDSKAFRKSMSYLPYTCTAYVQPWQQWRKIHYILFVYGVEPFDLICAVYNCIKEEQTTR